MYVYIKGIREIDDLFLKWCCEETERQPWQFIFFERSDVRYNYPERDRLYFYFQNHDVNSKVHLLDHYYTSNTQLSEDIILFSDHNISDHSLLLSILIFQR